MKRVERIVDDLKGYFLGKKVLEVACGDADFSLAAARYADSVVGIDVSLDRVRRRNSQKIPDNVGFQKMDAAQLDFEPASFDVVATYNSLGHLTSVINDCILEMLRVLRRSGCLIFIATWKMDRAVIPRIQRLLNREPAIKESVEIITKTYHASIWMKT